MYVTEVYEIHKNHKLYKYCKEYCEKAKLFRNAVVYRYRQLLFASWKNFKNLNTQQIETIVEFSKGNGKFKPVGERNYLPSYCQFDYVMKANQNPDYFSGLPKQTVQQIEKKVLQDFKSFMAAVKKYNKCHSWFTGKPKLPGYTRSERMTFTITNQDAVVYQQKKKNVLKLPLTKKKLVLGDRVRGKLKQVEVKPYYDIYKVCVVYEVSEDISSDGNMHNTEDIPCTTENHNLDKNRILALDLGINNFLTSSNNCGLTPFVINGKVMKSKNVYFNRENARLKAEMWKSQKVKSSKHLRKLWMQRDNYFTDVAHKISAYIRNYCIQNNIGTVVVGKNDGWKQKSNIGRENNQKFCFIPHRMILDKVRGKLESAGITYIEQEESYTSKASFLDMDEIPVYGKVKEKPVFSGKRKHRGLYISQDEVEINADVNGASNIIRKCFTDAFKNISDFSYLYKSVYKVTVA